MKSLLFFGLLIFMSTHIASAAIELTDLKMADGSIIQVCTRFPDPKQFLGKRPMLMLIMGSGRYDTCQRLEGRPWANALSAKGIVLFSRQKRGITLNPASRQVEINMNLYVSNTIPTLKADTLEAFNWSLEDTRIDGSRVAIMGGSEGTWMATHVGLKHPEIRELSLIGSAIERFDTAFERQISHLVPEEILAALDTDKSGYLTVNELTDDLLHQSGLLSFRAIDLNTDKRVDKEEMAAELRRAVNFSLATDSNTFFLSELFGGGVSVPWIRSAYSVDPLGPQTLQLKTPVIFHHGRSDINALVQPVYLLEAEAKRLDKTNLTFSYYDGLGHGLNTEVVYKILYDVGDRLSQ